MQKPENEVVLRKVLFDAILLVEYPFLYSNAKFDRSLTLTRLIATHEAVKHFRFDLLVISLCIYNCIRSSLIELLGHNF